MNFCVGCQLHLSPRKHVDDFDKFSHEFVPSSQQQKINAIQSLPLEQISQPMVPIPKPQPHPQPQPHSHPWIIVTRKRHHKKHKSFTSPPTDSRKKISIMCADLRANVGRMCYRVDCLEYHLDLPCHVCRRKVKRRACRCAACHCIKMIVLRQKDDIRFWSGILKRIELSLLETEKENK